MTTPDILNVRARALGFSDVRMSLMTPDSSIQRISLMLNNFEVWHGWSDKELTAFFDGIDFVKRDTLNRLKMTFQKFEDTLAADPDFDDDIIDRITPTRTILPPVGKGK